MQIQGWIEKNPLLVVAKSTNFYERFTSYIVRVQPYSVSSPQIPEDGEQQEEPAPVPETPIPQSDSTQPPESEPVKFVVQSSEEESKVSGEPVPVKEEVMVQETATLSSQPVSI